ncbi:MAG: MT-A70 family methyltransferase [Actinomycetota bacterium]
MKYRTIVVDPPWPYKSPGDHLGSSPEHRPNSYDSPIKGPGSRKRYGAMTLGELEMLSVPDLVESDAHLYLWTTNAFMVEAHALARAWGFRQKTILTWVKVHQDNPAKVSMKTGTYFRGATEHVLFCVRGSLRLAVSEALPTAYLWPRLPHSVKPDAFLDLVERASPGPYLEMFARRNRLGWDTWGNECHEHMNLVVDTVSASEYRTY